MKNLRDCKGHDLVKNAFNGSSESGARERAVGNHLSPPLLAMVTLALT